MRLTESSLLYLVTNWQTKTTTEIAEHLHVSQQTIYYWTSLLRKKGIALPKKAGMRQQYFDALVEDFKANNPNWAELLVPINDDITPWENSNE